MGGYQLHSQDITAFHAFWARVQMTKLSEKRTRIENEIKNEKSQCKHRAWKILWDSADAIVYQVKNPEKHTTRSAFYGQAIMLGTTCVVDARKTERPDDITHFWGSWEETGPGGAARGLQVQGKADRSRTWRWEKHEASAVPDLSIFYSMSCHCYVELKITTTVIKIPVVLSPNTNYEFQYRPGPFLSRESLLSTS